MFKLLSLAFTCQETNGIFISGYLYFILICHNFGQEMFQLLGFDIRGQLAI